MANINQLSSAESVSAGQQLPVYDPDNGDARKVSVSQVAEYMQDNLDMRPDDRFVTQYHTASGFGYNITLTGGDNLYLILRTTTAQTVGFYWFTDGSCVDGQEVIISTAGDLTIAFFMPQPTRLGWPALIAPPQLLAGGFLRVRYDAATATWRRIG